MRSGTKGCVMSRVMIGGGGGVVMKYVPCSVISSDVNIEMESGAEN